MFVLYHFLHPQHFAANNIVVVGTDYRWRYWKPFVEMLSNRLVALITVTSITRGPKLLWVTL